MQTGSASTDLPLPTYFGNYSITSTHNIGFLLIDLLTTNYKEYWGFGQWDMNYNYKSYGLYNDSLNKLQWYNNTSEAMQLNRNNASYYWMAIS